MASERDIQDIINTLIAEGVGEGEEGMRRIAETILNRAEQRGISPAEVVRQRAQYTGFSNPGPAAIREQSNPSAIHAARAAWQLAQGPDDPTDGANHYFNPNIVTPSWASQMTPTGEFGNHAFYTDREPEPRRVAPTPATPSTGLAQMRRNVMPTQLIPDTFARLPSPSRTLADNLAMDPVRGGQRQAPMFDAAFDERTGQMRLTREPIDSQGVAFDRSREPAPIPAMPSPQLAAKRANDPVLQAALNAKYPAQLPPLPSPPRPTVSASDLARGNSGISTVASIPTRPQVSASDLARGKSGISTIASYPTAPQVAQASIPGPNGYFNPSKGQERLEPGTDSAPGDALWASLIASGGDPIQTAQGKVAPIPLPRPDFLPQVATALDVKPMPPMPIPRPGLVRPMPASARPHPLSITVAGANPLPAPRPQPVSAVQALRNQGMSAAQAYDAANAAAAERARANAGSGGYSNIMSPGGQRYDATTGTWV